MLHWLCLYIHVCACVHSGTHNTSLTAGPSLQALGCLLLTLHICLSSSLPLSLSCFIFCFFIFLGCLKKKQHSLLFITPSCKLFISLLSCLLGNIISTSRSLDHKLLSQVCQVYVGHLCIFDFGQWKHGIEHATRLRALEIDGITWVFIELLWFQKLRNYDQWLDL